MIIKEDLQGIFDGSDVKKQHKQYLKLIRDYNGGEYFAPETKIHKRVVIPEGYNAKPRTGSDEAAFWRAEWDKLRNGTPDMSCLQYQYFNYYNVDGPIQFRRHDNFVNTIIEECLYKSKKGWGVITVGRRGLGKSNRFANTAINIILKERNRDLLLSSKREEDAEETLLIKKLQIPYDRLPIPIRPDVLNMNKGVLFQGYWKKIGDGQKRRAGKLNTVYAKGPKITGAEGLTLRAWLHDEGPKTDNLGKFAAMTLPALRDTNGMSRIGFPMISGVAGDFSKHGDGFKNLWADADAKRFIRIFEPGWVAWSADMGYIDNPNIDRYAGQVDAFGNENVENNVRAILDTRNEILNNKRLSDDAKEEALKDNYQQFPLTIQEAYMSSSNSFLNLRAIEDRKSYLKDKPIVVRSGNMRRTGNGDAVFTAEIGGKVKIVEPPQEGAKYIAGIDAYGIKNTANTGSLGAQVVWKLENTSMSPSTLEDFLEKMRIEQDFEKKMKMRLRLGDCPVAYYMDGPKDPDIYAANSQLLAEWYGRTAQMDKVVPTLIEKEPGLIYQYYMKHHKAHMMPRPIKPDERLTRKILTQYGIDMKGGHWVEKRRKELVWFTNNLLGGVFFEDLLEFLSTYDEDFNKHDLVDGLGISLIARDDERIKKWNESNYQADEGFKPMSFSDYRRN